MAVCAIGDIAVHRVEENAGPSFLPDQIYPDWTPEYLEKHREVDGAPRLPRAQRQADDEPA